METDYISREAALVAQNKSMNLKEMRERLERIPAADVRPVKRGEWRICDDYTSISKTRHRYTHVITWMCSECFAKNGRRKTKFCPNCGAKMKEEKQ